MEKTSAVDIIVNGLRSDIENGDLKPGDRFPAERSLAEKYGVSRNTVREAIRYFECIGLAQTKRGSGTYLVNDSEAMSNMIDARQIIAKYNYNEMVEARRIVEIGIVQLAAQHCNRNDKIKLKQMFEHLEEMARGPITAEKMETFMLYDYEMHHEIAKISGNSFLIEMHVALKGVILSSKDVWLSGDNMSDAQNPYHKPLVDAICDNDPLAAKAAMEKHLDHIIDWLQYRYKNGDKPKRYFIND